MKKMQENEKKCKELFDFLELNYEYENRKFFHEDGTYFTPSFYIVDVNLYVDVSISAVSEQQKRKATIEKRYPSDTYLILENVSIYELMYLMQFIFGFNFTKFKHLSEEEKEDRTKHFVLAMQEEIIEALRCINRKEHVLDKVQVNRKKLLLELVDVKHYFNTLCIIWDFTPEEIFEAYKEKNKINWERWRKRVGKEKGKKRSQKIQQK